MNRNKFIGYLLLISLCTLSACDKDAHKDENGLVVSLNIPSNDSSSDVRLWIYQADGASMGEYHYATPNQLAKQRFSLPTGEYILIAANNLTEPFSAEPLIANGVTPYEALSFQLGDASASPGHAHYSVKNIEVDAAKSRTAEMSMNRILAELQFTIKGVSADVIRAEARVTNVAKGFLPYNGLLLPTIDIAELGSITPQQGVLAFPARRIMPVVALATDDATNVKTRLQFTLYYQNGSTILCDAIAPRIENGGVYTPEVEFSLLRPEIAVEITSINGWIESSSHEGEILNPNK